MGIKSSCEPSYMFDGCLRSVREIAELAKGGDVRAAELLLVLHQVQGKHCANTRRLIEFLQSRGEFEAAQKIEDDMHERRIERVTRSYVRDLVERYLASHSEGFRVELECIPFGRILIALCDKAEAGDLRAAEQVFRLVGAYAPDKVDNNVTISTPIPLISFTSVDEDQKV